MLITNQPSQLCFLHLIYKLHYQISLLEEDIIGPLRLISYVMFNMFHLFRAVALCVNHIH